MPRNLERIQSCLLVRQTIAFVCWERVVYANLLTADSTEPEGFGKNGRFMKQTIERANKTEPFPDLQ